jgi:hypothetical protein
MRCATRKCLRLALYVLGFALAGCAVSSEVTYHDLKRNAADRIDGWIPFQLTDTAIILATTAKVPTQINPGGVAAGAKDEITLTQETVICAPRCDKPVAAFAAPVPFDEVIYAINPVSPFYKTTKIAPTYAGDTLRLRTLTIETQDHRKEIIETGGSIAISLAKTAAGFGAPPPPEEKPRPLILPTVIDLTQAKATINGRDGVLPGNRGWTYRLIFLDNPEAAGHFKREVLNAPSKIKGAAVWSACRPAKLILMSNVTTLEFGLTVADPDFVCTTPLPVKGTVNFHDLCVADVKVEQENTTSTKELVDTLFKQADDLRKVFQEPKSGS